jgi:hypothetical protein
MVATALRASAMISRPSRVVTMVSIELSQFCAPELPPWDLVRRDAALRAASLVSPLDFRAVEVVVDLAANRALDGSVIDLVAARELPAVLA